MGQTDSLSQTATAPMPIRSILVVDDDLDTLTAMRRVLAHLGYVVAISTDGHDAIRKLTRDPADLLITDMLMPHGDGFELIIALHRNFPTLPVVAMSGGGHLGPEVYLGMARGFRIDGVLRKPVTRDELVLAIKAIENRPSLGVPQAGA